MALDITGALPVHRPLVQPGTPVSAPSGPRSERGSSFAETLKGYLDEMVELERKADQQVQNLATGETRDVHQVMLAVEEANLALDLLLEIRNRLLDAYTELTKNAM
jgi:flagellar hook-basal body complex protein FliE